MTTRNQPPPKPGHYPTRWNDVADVRVLTPLQVLVQGKGVGTTDLIMWSETEEVWQARREVFSGAFPVSTLVEVRALASPEILVEIEAIGLLGSAPD